MLCLYCKPGCTGFPLSNAFMGHQDQIRAQKHEATTHSLPAERHLIRGGLAQARHGCHGRWLGSHASHHHACRRGGWRSCIEGGLCGQQHCVHHMDDCLQATHHITHALCEQDHMNCQRRLDSLHRPCPASSFQQLLRSGDAGRWQVVRVTAVLGAEEQDWALTLSALMSA